MTQFRSQERQDSGISDFTALRRDDLTNDSAELAELDTYLNSIWRLAATSLTDESLENRRRDMYVELRKTYAALIELGYDSKDAAAHTVAQFGSPESVARKWNPQGAIPVRAQALQKEYENTSKRTRISFRMPFAVWSLSYLFLFGTDIIMRANPTMADSLRVALTTFAIFGSPIVAGAVVGLHAKRRPVVSNAVGMLSALPFFLFLLVRQIYLAAQDGQTARDFPAIILVIWLGLSSISSALVSKLRKSAE